MKSLFVLALMLPAVSFANTYVKCGKSVDKDNNVEGYELELSSEGNDDYSGVVGKKWNMKLQDENSDWLKTTKKITARNYEEDGAVVVEITIIRSTSSPSPVGTTYKLIDLYSDNPTLEKYTKGGFAGTQKVGTFECFSGND